MKTEREPKIENGGQGIKPSPEGNPQGSRSTAGLRWFISKTVREASAMRKHVHRMLCAQRDILSPQAVSAVSDALNEMQTAIKFGIAKVELRKLMDKLEEAANKWLKPYPHHAWRENVEVFLVALAVAMAIRTFFIQPFKIPTGSMQPTLFGVISDNLLQKSDFKIPTGMERVKEWFEGISYIDVNAKTDGTLDNVSTPLRFLIFNIKQTVSIGGVAHTIWFPPDYGSATLEQRAGIRPGKFFRKGDQVVLLKTQAGDHLFVDRLTYNFRKPARGDIFVFATAGTDIQQQDQFYIKRLVGLPNETLSIKKEYEINRVPGVGAVAVGYLVVDGRPLSASTPHFENVYSFPDAIRGEETFIYHENHYTGHAQLFGLISGNQMRVGDKHYFAMGDNTLNSADSRLWGDVPEQNVIGKCFFVYWPISSRFGWENR